MYETTNFLILAFRWGFNRFGQLGLGLNESDQVPATLDKCLNPCSCLQPYRVRLFPGSVTSVDAAANSSAAIRAEDSALFTWGSGEAMRLGHKKESSEPKVAHIHTPRLVSDLCGKTVSSLVMTEFGGFAFVPCSVNAVEPPLVPASGGTRIILRGGGIWDSADCVVRFIPVESTDLGLHTLPKSCVGKFLAPVAETAGRNGKPGIICKMPRFPLLPNGVYAEVAMNGNDFTSDQVHVQLYDNPLLMSIQPSCCSCTSDVDLTISGTRLLETGLILVQFKELSKPHREWDMPGSVRSVAANANTLLEHRAVSCKSPHVEGKQFPIKTSVAVALNGIDYVALKDSLLVIHNAAVLNLVPDCRPLNQNQQLSSLNAVNILGQSLFDSNEMLVNLTFDFGGVQRDCFVRPRYIDTTTLAFDPPSLQELPKFQVQESQDEYKDESIPEEAVITLPEQPIWTCMLKLTLNGVEFLETSLPFILYRQLNHDEVTTPSLMCGPCCGGTCVTLQLPAWFRCPIDMQWPRLESAVARLRSISSRPSTVEPVCVNLLQQVSPSSEIMQHNSCNLLFTTPSIEWDAIVDSTILAPCTSPESSSCLEQNCGMSEAERTTIEMQVDLALDGQNFSTPCDKAFTYYQTPAVLSISIQGSAEEVPTATPGVEVSIFGRGFFESSTVKAVLTFREGPVATATWRQVDAVFADGAVHFNMPDLREDELLPRGEIENLTNGNECKLNVEVSFNGGENATSNGKYLLFLSRTK